MASQSPLTLLLYPPNPQNNQHYYSTPHLDVLSALAHTLDLLQMQENTLPTSPDSRFQLSWSLIGFCYLFQIVPCAPEIEVGMGKQFHSFAFREEKGKRKILVFSTLHIAKKGSLEVMRSFILSPPPLIGGNDRNKRRFFFFWQRCQSPLIPLHIWISASSINTLLYFWIKFSW